MADGLDAFLYFNTQASGRRTDGLTLAGESLDADLQARYTPNPIALRSFKLGFDIDENFADSSKASAANQVPKPRFGELVVEKVFDTSSTDLFKSLCAAAVHNEVQILQRRSGGLATKVGAIFMKMTFGDVVITNIEWKAGDDLVPIETVQLNFTSFKMEYTPQRHSGRHDAADTVRASYSVTRDQDG